MKRTNRPRLQLTKSTVRVLQPDTLASAAGASGLLCGLGGLGGLGGWRWPVFSAQMACPTTASMNWTTC